MSKQRVKKRFTSEVNIIDFQPYLPQKKQRVVIQARNPNQKIYLQKLQDENKSIVLAIGPAGTGKTMLAVQHGIKLFQEGIVDKIIVTRPAVSVDEDLGFLPGTLNEKMAPWTRPIFDVFAEYYQQKDIAKMLEDGTIEISPLAYMRGRTFKHAYIIADECQNTSVNQMKMLLTRLGDGSRMVVTGDLAQADRMNDNGLINFCNLLGKQRGLNHIDIVQFDHQDIERHHAVKEILAIYGDS
jgi:phosphate starvation-inducible protein PhoH and related proteins